MFDVTRKTSFRSEDVKKIFWTKPFFFPSKKSRFQLNTQIVLNECVEL